MESTRRGGISRRDFLKLMGIAAAAGEAAACTPLGSVPASQSGEKIQLVYQDFNTPGFPQMAQRLLEEFHAQHPNITVYFIPDPANLVEQMPVDMQAGTAPDLFQGCCTHLPEWAHKGYTLDLRPYVAADLDQATIADWDPVQYRALFTRDGAQFALPKYHGALALYFNKDLFDAARVDYPDGSWNCDDYSGAMKLLAHDANGDGAPDVWGSMMDVSWDRVQVHVNGWGGHFVDPENPTVCRMGEPEAMAAVEWLRARMWDDRVMAKLPDVGRQSPSEAFVAQKVAMIEDGSWSLKNILSKATFRLGLAPCPAGPVRQVTLATTDGFGIYAGTKHPEAAWELMKFLIGKDYGRAMARTGFFQPARASIVQDWIGYVREQFPDQTKDVDLGAFAEGQLKGYSVVAEIFPNMAAAQTLAQDAWDKILTLGQAPAASLSEVSQKIQAAQG